MKNVNKVVCFDAFGTLLRIGQRTHPERVFRDFLRQQGGDDTRLPLDLMAGNKTWGDIFSDAGVSPPETLWARWQKLQQTELSSVELYPETWEALTWVAEQGWGIAVVSNLASPYDAFLRTIERILKSTHPTTPVILALSCEVGAVKPDPTLFHFVAHHFPHLGANDFYMTGDKHPEDCLAPQQLGWNAVHLRRPQMTLWDSLRCLKLIPTRS